MALGGLVLQIAVAQTTENAPPSPSQLEALEVFAARQTATVTWSKEVGRIDTDRAHAVITALIVDDPTQTPSRMSGIRIDLVDGSVKDQVYASEDQLPRLVKALDEITNGLVRFHAEAHTNGCFGSGVFWQQAGHAFSASQCVFGPWEGVSATTGKDTFRFTSSTPATFAAAILKGRDELKQQQQ